MGSEHQPNPGSDTCVSCVWDIAGASCDAGFYAEASFQAIETYIGANADVLPGTDLQKHFWCAQGYACLPCVPGKYKSSTTAAEQCTQCAIGDYQNAHGQTACFDCAAATDEQVTAGTGSTESAQCQCNLGYEPPPSTP